MADSDARLAAKWILDEIRSKFGTRPSSAWFADASAKFGVSVDAIEAEIAKLYTEADDA